MRDAPASAQPNALPLPTRPGLWRNAISILLLWHWPGWAAGAGGPGGFIGAADRAEKYDHTINCSPFLLPGEQLLLIKICGNTSRQRPWFLYYSSIGEFRAVENDGASGQCRFPGD